MGSVIYTGKDITEEPDAVIPHVGICLGAAWVTGRPTKTLRSSMQDLIITILGSSSLMAIAAFLCKGLIIERLKNAVKYEYDIKYLTEKSFHENRLAELEFRLNQQNSLISTMSEKNLKTLDSFLEKQISAIDTLWSEMESMRKLIPSEFYMLDNIPSEYHELMLNQEAMDKNSDLSALTALTSFLKNSKLVSARLYAGELLYSYYSLYSGVVTIALANTSANRASGKFEHWYKEYNLDKLFSTESTFNFNGLGSILNKTSKMLAMIQLKFLEDAQRVLCGEQHLRDGAERVKAIQNVTRELNAANNTI